MIPYLRIAEIVIIVAALFGGYKYIKQIGYQQCQTATQEANLKAVTAFEERLKKAQEERDANQNTIDRLVAQSRSVRIHLPVCSTGNAKDQNGRTGLLSDNLDKEFAEFQQQTTELFKRCDELNLDAIRANSAHP